MPGEKLTARLDRGESLKGPTVLFSSSVQAVMVIERAQPRTAIQPESFIRAVHDLRSSIERAGQELTGSILKLVNVLDMLGSDVNVFGDRVFSSPSSIQPQVARCENITKLAASAGLTPQELADESRVSITTIKAAMRNQGRKIRPETLDTIARVLGEVLQVEMTGEDLLRPDLDTRYLPPK